MLRTHGRDTDDSNLILRLIHGGANNRNGLPVTLPFGWSCIGTSTSGTQLTPDRGSVIRPLDDGGSRSITDLTVAAGEEYDTMRKHLARMAEAGPVRRVGGGYSLISVSEMSGQSSESD